MDAVDVIVFVAEATICTMFKKVDFFPLLRKKNKIYLKIYLKRNKLSFLKARIYFTSSYQKSFF